MQILGEVSLDLLNVRSKLSGPSYLKVLPDPGPIRVNCDQLLLSNFLSVQPLLCQTSIMSNLATVYISINRSLNTTTPIFYCVYPTLYWTYTL
jgi:hypothetical protein